MKPKITTTKSGRDKDGQPIEVVKSNDVPVEMSDKHFTSPSIGMSKGVTMNMGNYNSLRVDVWLSLPLSNEPTREEISKKRNLLADYIDRILDEEIDKEKN